MSHKLDNLKAQRDVAGFSLTELARRANTSVHTLIRLENGGNVDPHVSQRIADALGVSLATLGQRDL